MGQGRGKPYAGWSATRARSIGALVSVAAPIAAVGLLVPDLHHVTEIAAVCGVVTFVVVLFADLLLYLHWRMTGGPAGWLVLGLTILVVQSLALAGSFAADPVRSSTHAGWLLFVQILVALGLLGLVRVARSRRLRVDPILAGVAIAVAVVLVRYLLVTNTTSLHLSDTTINALRVVVLLIDLTITMAIFRLTVAPAWVRVRLGTAVGLLGLGHAAAYPAPDGVFLSIVSVVTYSLGAAVLLSLAVALVSASWTDNRAALEVLSRQLERVEAGARAEQARLHELRATVAGLGTASRLVHQESAVSGLHRRKIEAMIDSEMARLQRLLSDETGPPTSVDLDSTIEPIVVRHRTRGYPIQWRPSGQRAVARADDVAEVVNVLLENAVQHAPGAGASIETRRSGGIVEIAISDTGPGIARALRSKIFEWGERGQQSAGSGIGLNVAQQLTADLGGYLRLVESPTPGATFVLGLPAEDPS